MTRLNMVQWVKKAYVHRGFKSRTHYIFYTFYGALVE